MGHPVGRGRKSFQPQGRGGGAKDAKKGVGILVAGLSRFFLPGQAGGIFVCPLPEGAAQSGRQPYA